MSLTDDMDDIFLASTNPFVEAITYNGNTINAQVERHESQPTRNGPKGNIGPIYSCIIWVSKTDVPSVVLNVDTVSIVKNSGSTGYRVNAILFEDTGSFKLGLV